MLMEVWSLHSDDDTNDGVTGHSSMEKKMKVRITKRPKNVACGKGEWSVVALQGIFSGREIAVVEGIQLEDVTLDGNSIIGHPTSVWGAVIEEDVSDDLYTIRGLGIGKAFNTARQRKALAYNGTCYVDRDTNRVVHNTKSLFVFQHGVFCH